jgi:beta-phosphoglucomutase
MTDRRAVIFDVDGVLVDSFDAHLRSWQANFPAMDGAVELIDALHSAGFSLAMGSSGPPENMQLALDRLARRDAFAAVVSGRDVRQGKPDPEVFLVAAQRLGVPPSRCVVVEDAPAGVQAAKAAGIPCVALLSRGRKREDFVKIPPDHFVQSLRDLSPEILNQLISS